MAIRKVLSILSSSTVFSPVNCDNTDAWVVINNATFYPLWVQFNMPQPTQNPAIGTEPYWRYEVGAGDTAKMPTPETGFDGTVWVGVFRPLGSQAAGVTQYATVSSFPPNEEPQIASSTPVTVLPQSRVVTIPDVASGTFETGAGNISLGTQVGSLDLLGGNGIAAGSTAEIYVYYITGLVTGFKWATIRFRFVFTNTGLPGGAHAFSPYINVPISADGSFRHYPSSPTPLRLTGANGGDALILVSIIQANNTQAPVNGFLQGGSFSFGLDTSGQVPPPTIGSGASTPAGTVY